MDFYIREEVTVSAIKVAWLALLEEFVEYDCYSHPDQVGMPRVRTWPGVDRWADVAAGHWVAKLGPGRYQVFEDDAEFFAEHRRWEEATPQEADPPLPEGREWAANAAATRRHVARWLKPDRTAPRTPGRFGRTVCGHSARDQARLDYWAKRMGRKTKDIATLPLCRLCAQALRRETA